MAVYVSRRKARGRVGAKQRTAEFDQAVLEFFMRIALEEAARGAGRTSPNPTVGAILVNNGRVVGRGYHARAGAPHAEVMAIREAGHRAEGAALFTTLEPCDHYGRTPPCSIAIREAGIRRVVCASDDPNPLVNGKGIARLRRAGIPVETGVLRAEADRLNRPFFKAVTTGLPYVTLKAAVTLDGKLATKSGDSRWVTGPQSRERVHQLRDRVDAVMVGAGTALHDDPQLTARLANGTGHDPVRIVVDSHLQLPDRLQLFRQKSSAPTIVATLEKAGHARAKALTAAGVDVWSLPGKQGRVSLKPLLKTIARRGWNHLLVEGGAQLFTAFLAQGLADELLQFVAPKIVGSTGVSWVGDLGVTKMENALVLPSVTVERLGDDVLLRSELRGR